MHHQRGLGVAGVVEFFRGAFPHDAAQREAEDVVGLGKGFPCFGVGFGQRLAHANGLGTLAGEEKGGLRRMEGHRATSVKGIACQGHIE